MNKKKKLHDLQKIVTKESLEIMAILESLILNSQSSSITCTLLEIAKGKTVNVFKKNEKPERF